MAKDADAPKKESPPRPAGFRLTVPGDDTPAPSAPAQVTPSMPPARRRGSVRAVAIGVMVGCAAAIALLIAERFPALRTTQEPTATTTSERADALPDAALSPPTDANRGSAPPAATLAETPPQLAATPAAEPTAEPTAIAPPPTAQATSADDEASKETTAAAPSEVSASPPSQESAGSSAPLQSGSRSSDRPVADTGAGSGEGARSIAAADTTVAATQPRNADCDKCPEIVILPGGSFSMGSREDASEQPVHVVTVKRFAIGKYPVTISEWKFCVFAGDCTDVKVAGNDETPVHNVSWEDARAYVAWLSRLTGQKYRLPSEAEWEYATRGGTETRYWWGAEPIRNVANCKDCNDGYDPHQPAVAGSFKPNPFGLHDMSGTVAQWVEDCWHPTYHSAPADGSAWQADNCRKRVLRGGSWKSAWTYLRSASRDSYDQNVRYITHGFRVAFTPQ